MGTRNFAKIPRGISDDRWSCCDIPWVLSELPKCFISRYTTHAQRKNDQWFCFTKRQRWKKWNLFISQEGYFRRHLNLFSLGRVYGTNCAKNCIHIWWLISMEPCSPITGKGIQLRSATLTIASDIIYRGYTSLVCPLCNSRNRF